MHRHLVQGISLAFMLGFHEVLMVSMGPSLPVSLWYTPLLSVAVQSSLVCAALLVLPDGHEIVTSWLLRGRRL